MMKQWLIITTTTLLITAVFSLGVRSRASGTGPATPSESFEHQPARPSERFEHQEDPARLRDAEERELRWRIAAALRWILTWEGKIWNCPTDKGLKTFDLRSIYQQHAGQDIGMSVARSENFVAVSFDALHLDLGFRRFRERGLGPPSVGYICENSFAEHDAAVRAGAAATRAQSEQAMSAARKDPQLGPILSEMDKKQSKSEAKQNETRRFALPPLSDLLKKNSPSTQETETVYAAILGVIRGEVEAIDCNRGSIRMTVPTFDVGDPEIYVLVEAPDPYGTYIKHISFDRSPETGDYEGYAQKDISVPQRVSPLRQLVTERAYRRLNFRCPVK